MSESSPFGARTTADQAIAGIDLSGKRFLVTGCNSGLGFETMNALAANGAHVIGLAKTMASATAACAAVGRECLPVACDLADFSSIEAAVARVRALPGSLDAVVANAAVAFLPDLHVSHGVEKQFLVNYLGHFALITALLTTVRDQGRIVMVGGDRLIADRPLGIDLSAMDGAAGYDPAACYARSKVAISVFSHELSRRLSSRGIAVNTAYPGSTKGTLLHRHQRLPAPLRSLRSLLHKTPQRGAATQTLLAASPRVAGITGAAWSDCRVTAGHPLLGDRALAERLWAESAGIVAAALHAPLVLESKPLQAAA